MYTYNTSISQAIREIITSNGLYLHAIRSGIANYTALAQKIKPEVDQQTSMPINVGTIAVAIKRLADTLQFEQKPVNDCTDGARMPLTGSIIDVDFHRQFYQLVNILDEVFEKESG